MSAPIPGWYADASHGNQVRWWNGTAWSDHPTPSIPAPAASVPAPVKKAPVPKAAKIAVAAALGLIVLIIAAGSGVLGQLIILAGLLAAALGAYAAAVGSAPRFRVKSRKIGALILGAGLFAAMIGGAANAATFAPPTASLSAGAVSGSDDSEPAETPTSTPTPTPEPVVEQKEVREPIVIPFGSTTTNDATLAVGTTAVTVPGVNGEKVIVHQVTYTDGVETERSVLREEITVQPVTQVTAVGTKQPAPPPPPAPAPAPAPAPKSSGCHSSYSGVCVPIASDVDCAGGGGNGPAYVSGPVQVVGHDEYQLDRDGDGIACD